MRYAAATQAANDAKMGVSFTVTGVNNQLNKFQNDLSTLQASSMSTQSLNGTLQNQLNALQSTFASHTHNYEQTSIGFTNVPLGNTHYASLITKTGFKTVTTSPPK